MYEKYSYCGPVMKFENCVATNWKAETYATSVKKARSNFVFQFKRDNGLTVNTKVTCPGKITKE